MAASALGGWRREEEPQRCEELGCGGGTAWKEVARSGGEEVFPRLDVAPPEEMAGHSQILCSPSRMWRPAVVGRHRVEAAER
ncbi:hypothetical protein E2562_019401 [Oryza meyeriana var. granulata]|uniref:Uncharacterized protein n=1 Tax=Oryza meyeriana var. granulata TaxID=110450 RepID=A0A6G1BMA3_9ORYZ|nr:hypothetical protein E2562_019401 [Oryza meyeriana var. granulata]